MPYQYKSSGTNSQGNHYCARDYGSGAANSNSYHYSNSDGSYYYSNPDGSTYYNNGQETRPTRLLAVGTRRPSVGPLVPDERPETPKISASHESRVRSISASLPPARCGPTTPDALTRCCTEMAGSVTPTTPTPAAAAAPAGAAAAAPARKKPRRNASFADDVRWQPSGPTLALRKDSVGGPFGFLNPTTALYDIRSNDEPGGGRADLADLTDAERQERAKAATSSSSRAPRPQLAPPPEHQPAQHPARPRPHAHPAPLLGRVVVDRRLLHRRVPALRRRRLLLLAAHRLPGHRVPHESDVAGGVLVFIGATLFQIGAVLLFLESYNDRAETQFGGAVEDLFVNRLGVVRRGRGRRHVHFEAPSAAAAAAAAAGAQGQQSARPGSSSTPSSDGKQEVDKEARGDGDARSPSPHGSHGRDDHLHDDDDDGQHHGHIFEERQWQWWPSWHDVTTHYMYEIGFLASFTMSVGATVFYISGILALPGIFDNLSEAALQGAYFFPYLLGGVLFALSSLFYILETQPNWYTPQPFKIGWHVGVWNMIGGVGWTLAASWGYCTPSWCKYQSELALIWASAAFSVGSALQWYESLDKYIVIIED
ncbi:hypothetical protein ACCO45_007048 [Purpureocillium lilacinum]|uniref:Uncharacterized protein n=1 Tax=Purpureocillium lilacinum TaxID=33203 RepID=A0ACC4DTY1_PURLI